MHKSNLLLFILFFIVSTSYSQLPAEIKNIKTSQISDKQLIQLAQQAQANGMSDEEIVKQLQSRGIPDEDIQALVSRIKVLGFASKSAETGIGASASITLKEDVQKKITPEVNSRVFGTELFSGASPIFVPDLKIATPKSFIIGIGDELQLDIYGNNLSSQKMIVSNEGTVNVKYIGPVNVNGVTIEAASGIIKSRLQRIYPTLTNGSTKIQLTLVSIRSIQVAVIGAVKKPGTITLPSISTLFNALYATGGPLESGSFRNIELIRGGEVIAIADLYDFIFKGDQKSNLTLQERDLIRVPFAKTQVTLNGELNRTGIFEVKDGEMLDNLFVMAGGFKSTSFQGAVTGIRITDFQKRIIDIQKNEFKHFKLNNGDIINVNTIIDKFENRVKIAGAVFMPGSYALETNMDLTKLIEKAQGLRPDAFLGRANIVKTNTNLKREYRNVDLKKIINGTEKYFLENEDSIFITSQSDLRDINTIVLNGPVKNPGTFVHEDSLTLQGLILQAGGFLENAELTSIEIGRRKSNIDPSIYGVNTSEIILINTKRELSKIGEDVFIQPFDIVSIKTDPAKVKQSSVNLSGEIKFPSKYTLQNPNERISSIINRAGGLLPYADVDGAKLRRKKEVLDTTQFKRLANASTSFKSRINKDSVKVDESLGGFSSDVAIDLKRAIEKPGSIADLTLKDGDELIIPKYINTVDIQGEVLKPVSIQFEHGRAFGNYVSAAGGFTKNAQRNRAFVIYSNGRSAKTSNILGIRFYPKVKAGSTVFVPIKPEQKGFDPSKLGVLISALTSLSTIFVLLFR